MPAAIVDVHSRKGVIMILSSKMAATSLFIAGVLASADALADTQFSYSSDELEWQWGKMNGEWDLYGSQGDMPSFAFSFLATDSWLSATTPSTFTIPVHQVSTNLQFFETVDINPGAAGTVTVNPDGSVSAWNFSMLLTELPVPRDPIYDVFDRRVYLTSAYGAGTCNCDVFHLKNTLFTYNGEYFEPLGPAEALYRGDSSPIAWSRTAISAVPEPGTAVMFLSGLLLLVLYGWRRRASDDRVPAGALPAT
jgi:hypothetical protein